MKNEIEKLVFSYKYRLLECIQSSKKPENRNDVGIHTQIAMYKKFIDDLEERLKRCYNKEMNSQKKWINYE